MPPHSDESNSFLNSEAISDDFFIEIVENKLNVSRNDFKLRLVLLSPATGANENYVAVLYRAKIKIEIISTKEKQSVDVIIKALLTTNEEMKKFSVFPRERFVYDNVLKSFEKIWLERGGEVVKFGPSGIKYEEDPYEQIIMDDLQAEGFKMLDRKVGLTVAQGKMLLAKLAKFHAASAIRYQTDGTIQDVFDRNANPLPLTEDSMFYKGFERIFRAFMRALESYGGCEEYLEKVKRWDYKKTLTQFGEVARPMKCGFKIFNHGDSWVNNMMFKSDENGDPVDVRLIDFQTPYWGTPSADVVYFLLSSLRDDVKVDHFDELVTYYHGELVESLRKLKYDQNIPTLEELKEDVTENASFAAFILYVNPFFVKNDSKEELSLDRIMSGEENRELLDTIFGSELVKKALLTWLPFMNERGVLDALII